MIKIEKTEPVLLTPLPIVATEGYLKARSSGEYGWFVSDQMILPYVVERRAFFNRLVFPSATVFVEPVSAEAERLFLGEVVELSKQLNVDFIYQPHTSAVFRACPQNSIHCQFSSFQVDLTAQESDLFAGLHHKHRNVIRKAMAEGVQIVSGTEYLDECARLIQQTMQRQSLPWARKGELMRLAAELGDQVSFYVAKKNGKSQGCAVVIWKAGSSAYYLHGGSIEGPSLGAMNYLQWKIMLDMKAHGVLVYDFMGARMSPLPGSRQESIQRFKSRFGGQLKVGYLWKYPLKPLRYKLFTATAKLNAYARGLKYTGDIIDQERARSHESDCSHI